MARNAPKDVLNRINTASRAWESLRPDKSYSGLSLQQFKDAMKPSHDARVEIADLEGRMQSAMARRDVADAESLTIVQRVVNAVKGDPSEGEDSDFYAAMGYVRKRDRSSGLTRRRAKSIPESTEVE